MDGKQFSDYDDLAQEWCPSIFWSALKMVIIFGGSYEVHQILNYDLLFMSKKLAEMKFELRGYSKELQLFLACLIHGMCFSQNLVPNPSFELLDTCFVGKDMVVRATGWWDWVGTPDYFHTCSPDPQVTVPNNLFSFQAPASGEAYCGYLTYYSLNLHEFIATKLIEPLEVGEEYFLSFKVNGVQSDHYAINSFANNAGMRFYASIEDTSLFEIPSLPNEAHLKTDFIVSDTVNWTVVSGTFISMEPYEYMALGNFFVNELTDTLHFNETGSNSAYVFIDDVCVSKNSDCSTIVDHLQESKKGRMELFPMPCTSSCYVKFNEGLRGRMIFIYDLVGNLIESYDMDNSEVFMLNTSMLDSGVYILGVLDSSDDYTIELIICSP